MYAVKGFSPLSQPISQRYASSMKSHARSYWGSSERWGSENRWSYMEYQVYQHLASWSNGE